MGRASSCPVNKPRNLASSRAVSKRQDNANINVSPASSRVISKRQDNSLHGSVHLATINRQRIRKQLTPCPFSSWKREGEIGFLASLLKREGDSEFSPLALFAQREGAGGEFLNRL